MTGTTSRTTRAAIEFGDYQTPDALAARVAAFVAHAMRGSARPRSIVEPTCGRGSLVCAALRAFPGVERVVGVDLCAEHVAAARRAVADAHTDADAHADAHTDAHARAAPRIDLRHADFFTCDWPRVLAALPEPVLVVGNPPWVTSSALSVLGSGNVPVKTNHQGRRGIEAVTGRANFDIAEWIVTHLVNACAGRRATVAMLVKTAVARKVLAEAWKVERPVAAARLLRFDARAHFGAAVDAGLLVLELDASRRRTTRCRVGDLDRPAACTQVIAYRAGTVVADDAAYGAWRHLARPSDRAPTHRWRSGIKHDCAGVMELRRTADGLVNGLGEVVDVEPARVYPMLKGAAVARGGGALGERFMIVTQTHTGDDTEALAATAPKTWAYLTRHGDRLDRRASVVYRGRPRFCMFGVGPYAFAPYKVAIGALAKRVTFTVVGPHEGRPVVFDDTVYALPFATAPAARRVARALNGDAARAFLSAFVFGDAKRPVTIDVLRRLSIGALLDHCHGPRAGGIVASTAARGR